MDIKQKLKIGALGLVAYFSGSQATHAQVLDKTKAKVVNVQKQSSEYWLNSTNGDRMVIKANKTSVDISDATGNGFRVTPNGKVTFNGSELDANDPDTKLMNTIASMATNQPSYKKHAGAIYSTENKQVTFDNKGAAWIVGNTGDKDLVAPTASEKDSKASMAFYENMKTQNPKLAEIAAHAIDGFSFVDLDPNAKKFISPDHYTADEKLQAYMPSKNLDM